MKRAKPQTIRAIVWPTLLKGERLIQVRAALYQRIVSLDRMERESKDKQFAAMNRRMKRICQSLHEEATREL